MLIIYNINHGLFSGTIISFWLKKRYFHLINLLSFLRWFSIFGSPFSMENRRIKRINLFYFIGFFLRWFSYSPWRMENQKWRICLKKNDSNAKNKTSKKSKRHCVKKDKKINSVIIVKQSETEPS